MPDTNSAHRLRQIAAQLDAWMAENDSSERGRVALRLMRAELSAMEEAAREAAEAEAAANRPRSPANDSSPMPDIMGIVANLVSGFAVKPQPDGMKPAVDGVKPIIEGVIREARSAATAFRAAMDEAARKNTEAQKPTT